jgi:hypothetical protein
MKHTIKAATFILFILFLAGAVQAGEYVKDFSFAALDGRRFNYESLKGSLLVVNIGSHW